MMADEKPSAQISHRLFATSRSEMGISMEHSDVRNIILKVELLRRKMLRPQFIDLGLTVGQGQPRILRELLANGAMTQRELADMCMLDVTTMSRTLDRLEQSGLIVRESHPDCRRSWLISLTDKGCEKAEQVKQICTRADEIICGGISEDELENLYSTMEKIEKNLLNATDE